ncbi:MAG: TonB-dependent receptor [Flavobacteriaceae bacterium]
MIFKTARFQIVLLVCFFTFVAHAQDDDIGTEVINVVRPYTPSVSDAFKIKETPSLSDSVTTQKKEVSYTIFSVPVASTFTPAKGKATTVERKRPEKVFGNYATLGFGNYTSVLGEFYTNFEISREDNVDFFFKHNSSQGGIEDVVLDDKFYNSSLDVNYTSRQRDMSYNLGVGLLHQLYNWYGIAPENLFYAEQADDTGVDHSYFGASAKGNVTFDDMIFSEGDIMVRYFGDSYSSSEINARVQPKFVFDLGGQDVGLNFDVNYLSGSFDRTYSDPNIDIQHSYLNSGVHPYIRFQNEDFSINLGAKVVYGMDMENSDGDFFIYPKLNASLKLVDEFVTVYAGVDGDLVQNTYYDFTQENPFLSPTLAIAPTDLQYEGFGGVKGKFTNTISYNLRGSYKNEIGKPLFTTNENLISMTASPEGYHFGNSFRVEYDDVTTLEVFGEIQAEITTNITLGLNASYFNYTTDLSEEAFNLPDLKASGFLNAAFSEKIFGGLSLFYVGERNDSFDGSVRTLDGYFDANVHVGYNINDQLTIFAKGSNLLSDNYEKWLNTPVQGIQALAGATYKFDW